MTLFTLKTRSRYTHTRHQTLRKRGKNPDKHVSNSHKQRALTFDFSSCLKRKSNDLICTNYFSPLIYPSEARTKKFGPGERVADDDSFVSLV